MKKTTKFAAGMAVMGAAAITLSACGNNTQTTEGSASNETENHTVAIITDVGGVDDQSFNQSAWEGLQAWGKENGLEKGIDGFDYFQSTDASQYTTNADQAVSSGFETIFGVGYLLTDTISAAATQNPDKQFGIIDSVIEGQDNVVSMTFKDHEAAYLAGIGAAYTTKTDRVGFIGGEEGVVIDRFQAGFEKGVEDGAKELGKEIKVDVQYAASFGDPAKGKALAANMYQSGADIIYHASGGTGAGLLQEAKDVNEKRNAEDRVWVIGVDRDQENDGMYKSKDGVEESFVLTSTIKGVGASVQDVSNRAKNNDFPGGEILVYGLKEGGVDITDGHLEEEAIAAIETARENVLEDKVTVPETPEK